MEERKCSADSAVGQIAEAVRRREARRQLEIQNSDEGSTASVLARWWNRTSRRVGSLSGRIPEPSVVRDPLIPRGHVGRMTDGVENRRTERQSRESSEGARRALRAREQEPGQRREVHSCDVRACLSGLLSAGVRTRGGLFAGGAFLMAAAACGGSTPAAPSPVPTSESNRTNVQLAGAGVMLGGVLVRPADSGLRPAIIVLHGFQPAGTNGASLVEPLAVEFASLGYVGLALSMRGWPPSGGVDDCGLSQPDDIAAALVWLAAQPGVDPNRLAVFGYSQGGQVALLTGTRTSRVRAIAAYYPVTDVERWKTTTTFPNIPEYITSVCEPGGADLRSPVAQAARIMAPVLLVHGDADTRVPTEQSLLMRDALLRSGRTVQLVLVPGAVHGFTADQDPTSRSALLSFLASAFGGTTR